MGMNGWIKRSGAVAFLGAALLVSLATGCGKSADTLYREGKELIGKPETQAQGMEALAEFEKRFPKDPRTPEVILAVATIHQSERKFADAEAGYARLMEKYPETAEAYKGMFLLGYMYYEDMKDAGQATEVLNRFVDTYPDSGLTVSAKVLLENIGLPVEQWSTVKNIMAQPAHAPEAASTTPAAK